MNWEDIIKVDYRSGSLIQDQKEIIDEIMSDGKERTARDVIDGFFDKKHNAYTVFTTSRNLNRKRHNIPETMQVERYFVSSKDYVETEKKDWANRRYFKKDEEE